MSKVVANPQSVAMHSAQSEYYKFRTPYIPELFKIVCDDLGITKDTVLMDLGCGRGEVSSLLANHAGQIYAIDGSQEMINLAIVRDNIAYQVTDLNAGNPVVSKPVNHLFFGRSIHWFSREALVRISKALLVDGGRIVVCSTQWSPLGAWGNAYFRIREKFAPVRKGGGRDFTGRTNLLEAGFSAVKRYEAHLNTPAKTNFMIGHTFSTTYREDLVSLEANAEVFRSEMTDALKPFDDQNKIVMKVSSWAIIYERANAPI